MALTADDSVARIMAACPSVPLPSPASALAPAISTTPPSPMATPNNRPTVSGSCRVHSKLIRQTNSGVVELRIAVSALSTDCWPKAMSVYGIAQATQPWMNRQPTKFQCDARRNQGNWGDGCERDLRQRVGHPPQQPEQRKQGNFEWACHFGVHWGHRRAYHGCRAGGLHAGYLGFNILACLRPKGQPQVSCDNIS